MAYVKIFFFFLTLLLPSLADTKNATQKCFYENGDEYALLRTLDSNSSWLAVNTKSLKSKILTSKPLDALQKCRQTSNYELLKARALSHPKKIANRGIKRGDSSGFALTVDMCPSSKSAYEEEFFKSLIERHKGFALTISMTQAWAVKHPKAFEQLKKWEDAKDLKVTWMNHGSTHPYQHGLALEKNFINQEGVDFKKEVLENEAFLIKEGRVPSIFYRFAGLVSNDEAYHYLIDELGLIPVGSEGWLAKGEKIKEGSIVLVHGNKNEPLGIKLFLESKSKVPVVDLPLLFSKD